jgi:hypothetical protein
MKLPKTCAVCKWSDKNSLEWWCWEGGIKDSLVGKCIATSISKIPAVPKWCPLREAR